MVIPICSSWLKAHLSYAEGVLLVFVIDEHDLTLRVRHSQYN